MRALMLTPARFAATSNAPYMNILFIIIGIHFTFNLAGTWAYYHMRYVNFFADCARRTRHARAGHRLNVDRFSDEPV
jgi:hypothetical protein